MDLSVSKRNITNVSFRKAIMQSKVEIGMIFKENSGNLQFQRGKILTTQLYHCLAQIQMNKNYESLNDQSNNGSKLSGYNLVKNPENKLVSRLGNGNEEYLCLKSNQSRRKRRVSERRGSLFGTENNNAVCSGDVLVKEFEPPNRTFIGTGSLTQLKQKKMDLQSDNEELSDSPRVSIHKRESASNDSQSILMSSGKQYDQPFKRDLVKQILAKVNKQGSNNLQNIIKVVSHQISVHSYEIKTWLSAYQIIFVIERSLQESQGTMSVRDQQRRVQAEFLKCMKENISQRKYKFIRIMLYVVRILNLPEYRVSSWINDFVSRNRQELHGLDFSQYGIKGFHKKLSARVHQIPALTSNPLKQKSPDRETLNCSHWQSMIPPPTNHELPNKSSIILNKLEQKMMQYDRNCSNEDQCIRSFPDSFKFKIAMKIDHSLRQTWKNAVQREADELCLPRSMVAKIYEGFGQFQLIQTGQGITQHTSAQAIPCTNYYREEFTSSLVPQYSMRIGHRSMTPIAETTNHNTQQYSDEQNFSEQSSIHSEFLQTPIQLPPEDYGTYTSQQLIITHKIEQQLLCSVPISASASQPNLYTIIQNQLDKSIQQHITNNHLLHSLQMKSKMKDYIYSRFIIEFLTTNSSTIREPALLTL